MVEWGWWTSFGAGLGWNWGGLGCGVVGSARLNCKKTRSKMPSNGRHTFCRACLPEQETTYTPTHTHLHTNTMSSESRSGMALYINPRLLSEQLHFSERGNCVCKPGTRCCHCGTLCSTSGTQLQSLWSARCFGTSWWGPHSRPSVRCLPICQVSSCLLGR